MTIESVQTTILDPAKVNEIIVSGTQPFVSETEKLSLIDPAKAFSPADILKIKTDFIPVLESKPNKTPEEELLLKILKTGTPEEISAALYKFGLDPAEAKTLKPDSNTIASLSQAMSIAKMLKAGGCSALVAAQKAIKSPTELSMKDLSSLASGVAGGAIGALSGGNSIANIVGGALGGAALGGSIASSLTSLANKSTADLTKELVSKAQGAAASLTKLLSGDITIGPDQFLKTIAQANSLISKSLDSGISGLASGLVSTLKGASADLTKACTESGAAATKAEAKQVFEQINQLGNKLKEVPQQNLNDVKPTLDEYVANARSLVKDLEVKDKQAQSAANAKKLQDNNPDSSNEKAGRTLSVEQHRKELIRERLKELDNLVKKQTADSNKDRDDKIKREIEYAKRKVREAVTIYKDLINQSKSREADSAAAGRKVPDRADIVGKAEKHLYNGGGPITAAYFYPSKYAKKNARMFNGLHPNVRNMFANATREYIQKWYPKGHDLNAVSGFRSVSHQWRVYRHNKPRGIPAAYPGRSWHQFGLACDISLVINGRAQAWAKRSNSGTTFAKYMRPIFLKHDLDHPVPRDAIHWQPTRKFSKYMTTGTSKIRREHGDCRPPLYYRQGGEVNKEYLAKIIPKGPGLYDPRGKPSVSSVKDEELFDI